MDEPDWSQLPDQPLRFLGLNESFDRKDLKRAYGRLIKVYKPEIAPEKFQQIREAYEQLEFWLKRFDSVGKSGDLPHQLGFSIERQEKRPEKGEISNPSEPVSGDESDNFFVKDSLSSRDVSSEVVEVNDAVEEQAQGNRQSENHKQNQVIPPETVEEILQKTSPLEWYSALVEKVEKSPEDYLRLAFLSETVEQLELDLFLRWLCSGLKKYPRDLKLTQLVYHYCQNLTEEKSTSDVLLTLVHQLPVPQTFSLAENLWDRLMKRDFSEFCRLWNQFVEPHKIFYAPVLIPFLVERLTVAVWQEDQSWLKAQIEFIEENYDLVQDQLEYQFSFYEVLQQFLLLHACLLKEQPEVVEPFESWRIQLKKYCLAVTPEERDEFCRYQRKLAETFGKWSRRFTVCDETKYQLILARVWDWASHQASPAASAWGKIPQEQQAVYCFREWLVKQKQPFFSRQISVLVTGLFFAVSAYLLGCLTYLLSVLMTNQVPHHDTGNSLSILVGSVLAVPLAQFFHKKFSKWKKNEEYCGVQRDAVACLLENTRITYRQFYAATDDWLTPENGHLKAHHLMLGKNIRNDPALMIYRRALDFQI